MASPTFVAGTDNFDQTSPATSLVLDKPVGTAEDHLLLAIMAAATGPAPVGNWTPASGFSEIVDVESDSGRDRRVAVAWKIAGASEPSNYTFTNANDQRIFGIMTAWSGVDTSTPFDVSYVDGTHRTEGNNDENVAAGPITTVTNEALVVLLQYITHNDITATGMPTGYTEAYAENGNDFDGQGVIAYKAVASAGLETPGVWTHTENGTGVNDTTNVTVALRPAASSITPQAMYHYRNHGKIF